MWNIIQGYEHNGPDFEMYDQLIDEMRASRQWDYFQPIKKLNHCVFTDSGAAMLGGYGGSGLDGEGFIYTMTRL